MYFSNWRNIRVYVNDHEFSPLYIENGTNGIVFSKRIPTQVSDMLLAEINNSWSGAIARAKRDLEEFRHECELEAIATEARHSDWGKRD